MATLGFGEMVPQFLLNLDAMARLGGGFHGMPTSRTITSGRGLSPFYYSS